MLPGKGLVGFAGRLLIFFGLLAWVPWPGFEAGLLFRQGYFSFVGTSASFLFGSSGPQTVILFGPTAKGDKTTDIDAIVYGPGFGGWQGHIDVWRGGYLPTVEVVALILATPIPWRRRWKALLWGLLGAHVFVAARVGITLLFATSLLRMGFFADVSPFWPKAMAVTYDVCMSLAASWVVPIFIWILATFRRADLLEAMGVAVVSKEPNSVASRSYNVKKQAGRNHG